MMSVTQRRRILCPSIWPAAALRRTGIRSYVDPCSPFRQYLGDRATSRNSHLRYTTHNRHRPINNVYKVIWQRPTEPITTALVQMSRVVYTFCKTLRLSVAGSGQPLLHGIGFSSVGSGHPPNTFSWTQNSR